MLVVTESDWTDALQDISHLSVCKPCALCLVAHLPSSRMACAVFTWQLRIVMTCVHTLVQRTCYLRTCIHACCCSADLVSAEFGYTAQSCIVLIIEGPQILIQCSFGQCSQTQLTPDLTSCQWPGGSRQHRACRMSSSSDGVVACQHPDLQDRVDRSAHEAAEHTCISRPCPPTQLYSRGISAEAACQGSCSTRAARQPS